MELHSLDLVAALQALTETDPVEVEGIQFGGNTCQSACILGTINVGQTVCLIVATCK